MRKDPRIWFTGFGRYRDEQTRQPIRGKPNILQRRVFEHYRRCQEEGKPARLCVLKYRRAGSSTAGNALIYLHAQNHNARLGVIGTDYKASDNMLQMVKFYGEHDDFPGWSVAIEEKGRKKIAPEDYYGDSFDVVPFDERTNKIIATKLVWKHGSSVELYTAKNPESARSAGLSGYLATEIGRWPIGGAQDGGETVTAMRNTLPKKGFHVAIEESTAKGAQGVFYDTCRTAKWPSYATWWKKWEACWPLQEQEFGADLQFTFIFAAWFEDERHVDPCPPDLQAKLEASLDADEKQLIALYGEEGPKGLRLGSEVNATVWEQLAWRRSIIANVCTKGGKEEFAIEYPSNPQEAFRASGTSALDQEGVTALELACRKSDPPQYGQFTLVNSNASWMGTTATEASAWLWEHPIEGARYLMTCDPMSGEDMITGNGEKDRHAVFVIRDKFMDTQDRLWPTRVVARIKPPCQWEVKVLTQYMHWMSIYYGNCPIVVEMNNTGSGVIRDLRDTHGAHLYVRKQLDTLTQKWVDKLGWQTDAGSRAIAIQELQQYVREQLLDLKCPHAIGEFKTLIIDKKGKAVASGSNHDDDALALAIGLACLNSATVYRTPKVRPPTAPDAHRWKSA